MIIFVIWLSRRQRWLAVGWLWYLGTLVPVIGIIQTGSQAIADRYTYITIIGLFIIIAWTLPQLVTKWRFGKIVLGVSACAALAVMLLCTRMQVKHWKNSYTLFTHALKVTNNNIVAHHQLGSVFLKQKNFEKAVYHNKEVLKLEPDFPQAHQNMAIALTKLGRFDKAIEHYQELLKHKKENEPLNNSLGSLLLQRGRIDEAIKHFTEATRLDPDKMGYRMNLSTAMLQKRKTSQRKNEMRY